MVRLAARREFAFPAGILQGSRRGRFLFPRAARPMVSLLPLFLFFVLFAASAWGGNIQLSYKQGAGVPITGANPNFGMNFGQVNGLGAGAFTAGLVVSQPYTFGGNPGALYMDPFLFNVKGHPNNHRVTLTGRVTTNFTHAAALVLMACPIGASCTSAGNYAQVPVGAGAFTFMNAQISNNVDTGIGMALWVAQLSGASAFTGTECATITITAVDVDSNTNPLDSDTDTIQVCASAVSGLRLVISTAGAAPNCAVADPGTGADYSFSLGNVNGLGVPDTTSASPCSSVDRTVASPIFYTQYRVTSSFTNFASSAASLQISRTTNFAKGFLQLRESTSALGLQAGTTFPQNIAVTSGQNGVAQTRFVGVAVTANNGAASSAGADSATLTYTLTVP
jgi:hypothetical protein